MKKFLIVILLCVFCFIPVDATGNIEIESIKAVKSSDGVVLNTKDKVDAIFNDLNQQVKYEATIKNNSDKKMYINFLEVENKSEKFMEYKLDSKSENIVLEPNESSKVNFYINTLAIEGAGRNLDDNIKINFLVSDKIFNPNTFSNVFDLVILLLVLGSTMYFIRKNKKVKTFILIVGISVISINYVSANDYIKVQLSGNIKYTSQNNIITTGTTLNNKKADYTNSKEVWAYYDKVKNVEVKSLLNEPKKYYKKFDLTENKTGRVMAYLTENNDKDTPYNLTIMSQGVIIANPDASFMFSFPNTEKVEGLSNVDFRNTTTMQGMFIGNEKLEKIDTEAIELKSTIDTSYMFYDCEEIEHSKSDFNLENVQNTTMMFTPYLFNEVKDGAKVETDEVFAKSPSETNLRGNFIRKDTLEDEYPIYYYRGAVTNNNVKFAGYCWQIVRTTETGGVKLVYNGTPNTDGTCKGPGEDISIGNSIFNPKNGTLASAGYMYGKSYESGQFKNSPKNFIFDEDIGMGNNLDIEYYYSKTYEYKDGIYTLTNPVSKKWRDSWQDLKGYYTCRKTTTEGCSKIYYISLVSENKQSAYGYSNGQTIESELFILGKSYQKNDDNTYTLKDTIQITKPYWADNYERLKKEGYYVCDRLKSINCNQIYKASNGYNWIIYEEPVKNQTFANDVEYVNGEYILKDMYETDSWASTKDIMAKKYHYTCLNGNTKCTNVYYIYDFTNSYLYTYLILSNGTKMETAYHDMIENKQNSNIKEIVDNWYSSNLISYTEKLEDAVWCNDRYLKNISFYGKDHDSTNSDMKFNGYDRNDTFKEIPKISLNCQQKNDMFTVDEKNGNGALTYPIGLLTIDEVTLSGGGYYYIKNSYSRKFIGETYLSNGVDSSFYTMTPQRMVNSNYGTVSMYYYTGQYNSVSPDLSTGVRPAVSLKNKIKYTTGKGTKENPYVIE